MTPFEIEPRPVGSLEHIFMQSGYKNTFIDLSKQTKKDAFNAWMFEPVYASEDGLTDEVIRTNAMKFIPREQYDGILVVDEVNAPTPLKAETVETE
ncbi:Erythromycin esterase [compost metagenome]